MADLQKLLKLMVDLKEIEAELTLAICSDNPRPQIEYALKKVHNMLQVIEIEYCQRIEEQGSL